MSVRTHIDRDGRLVVQRTGSLHPFYRTSSLRDSESTAAEVKNPYAESVWVMRAIKYCAGPLAAAEIKLTEDRPGGDAAIEIPEFAKLMKRPARNRGGRMSFSQFIQANIAWLKLKGEAFWILDDSWLGRRGGRAPVIMARPDSMREILDADRNLIGWSHTDGSKQPHGLPAEMVWHAKFENPYNEIRGLAEWEAARVATDADYAQAVFAKHLAQNNGDRGPYVIAKGGMPSDEQIEQITAQLIEKRRRSRRGDFRAVFIPGDIDVKDPAVQAIDAAYAAQRLGNRHEIFLAFGVPPSFADVTASYSIGSASDRAKLIEETVAPLGAMLAEGIAWLASAFENGVEMADRPRREIFADFDMSRHSVVQQVRAERLTSAAQMVDRGVPWRKAGEFLSLDLPRFAGDEVGRVPFNLVELGAEQEPAPTDAPPTATDDGTAAYQSLRGLFAARIAERSAAAEPPLVVDTRAAETWARVHRAREAWEKRFASRFSRHLMAARKATLAKLQQAADAGMLTAPASETKGIEELAAALTFNLPEWIRDFLAGMLEVSRNALEAAGFELWSQELLRDDPLTMPAAQVLAAMRERENKLRGAAERVWEAVRGAIETGLTEGESIDAIALRVRKKFNGIDETRARTIAHTETTFAYEAGRDMVFQQAGVQWTEWVTAQDGRERETHRATNGQRREVGDPFDVGEVLAADGSIIAAGTPMAYPGDPAGPAEEVINCRCVRIAIAPPKAGDGEPAEDIPY